MNKNVVPVLLLLSVIFASAADSYTSSLLQGSVKVQVVDAKGRPAGGVPVFIFKKGNVKCICKNGQCVPDAVAAGATKKRGDQTPGPVGQVEFKGLAPETEYTAVIDVKCNQAVNPCQGNQNCGIQAPGMVNFTTDKRGNAPVVVIRKP